MNPAQHKRLQEFTSLYLDGGIDRESLKELEKLIAESEEASEAYIALLTVHSDLAAIKPADRSPASNLVKTSSSTATDTRTASSSSSWLRSTAVGMAASLLTLATIYGVWQTSGNKNVVTTPITTPAADQSVAHIIRKVDCDWEGDRWGVVSSSKFASGQTLSMARGLMELEFSSGARVTLEAPVSFTIDSDMRGTLSYGKLTAQVPDRAQGFTISTPRGQAIDLGTEFGLMVKRSGETETHVFKGEVIVQPDGSHEKDQLRLTTDMAIRQGTTAKEVSSLDSVRSRFISLDISEPADCLPPIDRKLTLWFAADQRIQLDEQGRVSAWGDLSTVGNNLNQNAWQVEPKKRPSLIKNSIGGLPAVHFSGKSLLITEPVKFGTSQSVAVVFKVDTDATKAKGVTKSGLQILNMNGPPHLSLRVDQNGRLLSQVYPGYTKNDEWKKDVMVGRSLSRKSVGGSPTVAVSVYDPETGLTRLYVNGVLNSKSKAPKLSATESPRYIGGPSMASPKSHFLGDISELLVYDTGLTDEEAIKVSTELMKKYGIEPK